jgi:hypothetical protein
LVICSLLCGVELGKDFNSHFFGQSA